MLKRAYDKEVNVPAELRGEMARAAAEGNAVWLKAKAASDFEMFLPALERNIETRHRYVEALAPEGELYDVLLDDFEPEMRTGDVTRIFAEIRDELVPLIAELREREVDDAFLTGDYPSDRQIPLLQDVIDTLRSPPRQLAHRPDRAPVRGEPRPRRRADHDALVPEQPRLALLDDARVRSRPLPASAAGRRRSTPVGRPASLGIHESQSRLWENLVGRSLPFWRFYLPARAGAVPRDAR